MNEKRMSERLNWLGTLLAEQRNNISDIMLRLRGMGARAGNSLALHLKFTHLMEQISFEREKELDILHEIDVVEKKHEDLKQRNLLRRAEPEKAVAEPAPLPAPEEEEPKRFSLLTLFGLLYLFGSKPAAQKKQGLTAD